MIKTNIIFAVFFVSLTAFALSSATNWNIANGYSIKFSGNDVSGEFEKILGTINFDEKNLASSKFSVNVDVKSIATGNWLMNKHAKGDKWFDADKYPTINFTSSKISKTATGFLVTGNLTMHGITKQIEIPFSFTNNTFKGSFSVNRIDYSVGNLEGMSRKVANKMDLDISIPVKK